MQDLCKSSHAQALSTALVKHLTFVEIVDFKVKTSKQSKPTIKCTTKCTFRKRDVLQSTFGRTAGFNGLFLLLNLQIPHKPIAWLVMSCWSIKEFRVSKYPGQNHVALGYSFRRQNMPPRHLLPRQNMPSASLSLAKDATGNLQPTICV